MLVGAGVAHAGDRDFDLVFVNGSGKTASSAASKLFELFKKDISNMAMRDPERTHITVVDGDEAAAIFESGCAGKVRDEKAFKRAIEDRVGHPDDIDNDALLYYCHDGAARHVTLVMFDDDGREMLRIVVGYLSVGDSLLKEDRKGLVTALLATYPWTI
jgi:hypothetical protein